MAKPEWGTKRTCPKCGTRFYDLQKDDPVTCIDCGNNWNPEPILKAKQPVMVEETKVAKPKVEAEEGDDLNDDDDLEIDDDDDMLGDVSLDDDDDDEVSGMVDTSLSDDEN
ncbi:MAG: TIGR02300 family protein [Alphaproteobacteria bacterium]|nr:MAG: TIGR02300 family protein [Alphaproteobacteria bacterium]